MSHLISQTNGIASFADSKVRNGRVDAWHQLGTPVGHEMTAEEVLKAAYLADWDVRTIPLWGDLRQDEKAQKEGLRGIEVPEKYGVIFNNPATNKIQALPATVGNRYDHVQNEALAQFGEVLVDELGQRNWQTAGSLRNYTQVFMTMLLPNTMVLTGQDGNPDVTEYYLALLNSHDGSSSLTGLVTPVRIVCANTQDTAKGKAVSSFKIRHTSGWRNALEEARKTLGLAFKYQEAFEAEAKALYAQEMSDEQAKTAAYELLKVGDVDAEGAAATRRRNEANGIYKLFVESPTIKGIIGNTKWGFYNAVSEYVDHYQNVRGANGDEAGARAVRTITASQQGTGLKAKAWEMLVN